MKNLNFETGMTEYQVNGGGTIRFNPADAAFVKGLSELFAALGQGTEGSLDDLPQREAEVTAKIDALFGPGTSRAVFGDQGAYALAGGLPLWANFLLAVLDEVESAVRAQPAAASPRVEEYMKKYAAYV